MSSHITSTPPFPKIIYYINPSNYMFSNFMGFKKKNFFKQLFVTIFDLGVVENSCMNILKIFICRELAPCGPFFGAKCIRLVSFVPSSMVRSSFLLIVVFFVVENPSNHPTTS
jgi:hypothetical protein